MTPLTVLIADDRSINLRLLRAQLEAEGHTVIEASNGAEALAALETAGVDLIISDILMPVMDGYRFCGEVRRSPRHLHLPFIFYTATYTSPADEQLCTQLGADKYLRKPVPVDELLAAIDEVMAAPRRKAALALEGEDVLKEYNERLIFKLEQKNDELAKASDELGVAHAQLREFLEHSPAVLYALSIVDAAIVPRLVSENVLHLLGYEAAETRSHEWWREHLHPDDRALAEAGIEETRTRGQSHTEYRIRHKDGTYRWIEDNRRLVLDAGGRPVELVGVWTNITERKRMEDESRETERRLREMLGNLDLIAVMLDREARIIYCNDYLLRLTGWQRDEVLGRDWFQLFIPHDRLDDMHEAFASLLANQSEAWHWTNEILTRSGERRLIHWNNSLLHSPAGELIGTASIAEDVTDRTNLEKQMLRTQRLESLGTLAGGIAHDMNNLLMPILTGVTLLRRLQPSEVGQKTIDIIDHSVKRARDLVKQMLLFARGTESAKAAVQMIDVIREIEDFAVSLFPKDITFEVSVAEDLGTVVGDSTQLTQVLLNLCVNARDAMKHGGQISISATNAEITERYARQHGGSGGGPYVVLAVSDTGSGIPKEIVDQIFDPFFTTKEVGRGTGLGLSTAQGIVSSHGGFLAVSSTPGEGTTFRVYLPAQPKKPSEVAVEPEEPPHGSGQLIMIVDDEAAVIAMLGPVLELFGYRVLAAEDGAQAIGLYARRHSEIALVLTDMVMPVIDGLALITALLRIDPDIRIIAATGDISPGLTKKLTKLGVTHILSKPYTAEVLLQAIAELLE
jgi:two-component system, cell cycle sensor histidine kinase and response regulator CckA